MRTQCLTMLLSSLSACATVGRVAYSNPVISSADGVRHVEPRYSAVEAESKAGVSVYVDLLTYRFAGVTGLLVPIIPYAIGDLGSGELLHVTLSLTRHRELLIIDPSAITMSVAGRTPATPVCAVSSTGWVPTGGRHYVYHSRSDVSGRCERGLVGGRFSSFETGAPTDTVGPNDTRTYDLFYPIRVDESRPLLLRIDGLRSQSGVIVLPVLQYARKSRWRFAFGAPF